MDRHGRFPARILRGGRDHVTTGPLGALPDLGPYSLDLVDLAVGPVVVAAEQARDRLTAGWQ